MPSSPSNTILPPPEELGILPEHYAYCYCEENVRRAIRDMMGKVALFNSDVRKIEPFAVFCSSYVQPEQTLVFPGSWLLRSMIRLVVNARTKQTISWDYHVFIGVKVTTKTEEEVKNDEKIKLQQKEEGEERKNDDDDDDEKDKEKSKVSTGKVDYFIADYDSNVTNNGKPGTVQKFVPLQEYCTVTFSKADKSTCRLRVIEGMDYWDKFRSTRAHMLPPPILKLWLQDKTKKNMPVPPKMLQEPPHPTDAACCGGDDGVDLANFVNMHSSSPAPGKVMTIDEFKSGKWQ